MIRNAKFAPLALALALGAGSALSLPAASFVQAPAAPQAQPPAQPQPHQRAERPSRIEGRIAFMRTELHITDAQAQLWDRVATTMRDNDRAMRDAFASMRQSRNTPPNAMERLDQRQKLAELRATSATKFRDAFAPLYASMSDDQKKNADQLLAGPHHGRMGHRRT